MSPHGKSNILGAGKDESSHGHSSTSRKTPTSSSSAATARAQEPALKCPRCDSANTKFCYYNNYSLTQPRHFCKTCRRYWTRGGALRSVPIGGGCRKNKKVKSSDSKDLYSSSHTGLKLFQGLPPAMDFHQINVPTSTTGSLFNKFSSTNSTSPCNFSLDPLMGFGFSASSAQDHNIGMTPLGFQEIMGSTSFAHGSDYNLASSIESLSCINQDLHWKLQQQRLSTLFENNNQKEISTTMIPSAVVEEPLIIQKPQPINLFQSPDNNSSKPNQSCLIGTSSRNGNLSTEWFFDNSFASVAPTPATSSSNNGNDQSTSNWSSGNIQAWSELTQYTSLP